MTGDASTAVLVVSGALTGLLGSTLGLGGGVFLVPLLALSLGLPPRVAVSASLVAVVATSAMTTTLNVRKNLVNVPLGLTLLVATVLGARYGAAAARGLSTRQLFILFSATLFAMAIVTVARSHTRNVIEMTEGLRLGPLDGVIAEGDRTYAYRARRVGLALAVSLVAGAVSGVLGVGGGVIQVPVLNSFCGIPVRVAAATSGFMIGPTAAASAFVYLSQGDLDPRVAAAVALGSLPASLLGSWLSQRARVRWIKLVLAAALTLVASRVAWVVLNGS